MAAAGVTVDVEDGTEDESEAPERADELYLLTAETLRAGGVPVETGVFRTHMEVSLVNDGPVTILLDSKKLF